MANAKHLEILKSGVEKWNEWRMQNKDVTPDLYGANLYGTNLSNADLSDADLSTADLSSTILYCADLSSTDLSSAKLYDVDLSKANLSRADLSRAVLCNSKLHGANLYNAEIFDADLSNAKLSRTNLSKATLSKAKLSKAKLSKAKLSFADLSFADLSFADLSNTDLAFAKLEGADLSNAKLNGADLLSTNFTKSKIENTDFGGCHLSNTIFGLTNLSNNKGLESVEVSAPCVIDFPTLQISKNLPKEFLTKLGIPDLLMEYLPEFYNPALMIYPVFLSHSWNDKVFVRKLYEALTQKGVTVWLDEKKMKMGDNIHDSISEGIKYYDKLILVCSEYSLNSWWVEKELEKVYEKERAMQKERGKKYRLVIPIRIDDSIFNCTDGILGTVKGSLIGDFIRWQDEQAFEKAVKELVDALNANRVDIKPPSFL